MPAGSAAHSASRRDEARQRGRQFIGQTVNKLAAALSVVSHPRHVIPARLTIDFGVPAFLEVLSLPDVVDDVLHIAFPVRPFWIRVGKRDLSLEPGSLAFGLSLRIVVTQLETLAVPGWRRRIHAVSKRQARGGARRATGLT